MAAGFPRLIALLSGLCLADSGVAAQAVKTRGPTWVVTGETLRRAGATRLSDVLLLAAPWHVATVDGFGWQAAPNGGSPFVPARWIVLVDGRPTAVDLFGYADLDRAAVPLDQIARVEFAEAPRLEAGRITSEGIVHIHTRDPDRGTTAGGWFATGTEIGDAGPFAFTPLRTENVDRLGHDASARVAHGGASWFASAALASSERIPTDPAIAARYAAALGNRPRLDATGLSGVAGARLGGATHRLAVRHSDVGGALALSPIGTEIGARQWLTQLGLAGTAGSGQPREVSYDLSHTINRARRRGPASVPALDWEDRTTEARLELVRRSSPLPTAGIRLRRTAVHSPDSPEIATISLATVYAELAIRGDAETAPLLSTAATFGEGEVGVAAAAAQVWSLGADSDLEGVIGYERTVLAEDNSIWAWTERGYPLLEDAGAGFELLGTPRAPERISADLRWSYRAGTVASLLARGLFRRERNLSLELRRLHYATDTESLDGPVTLVHGVGGELASAGLGIEIRPRQDLTLALSYWLNSAVGGDAVYRETWATVPRHGARVTSEYIPVPGLELWLSATYRSGSRWAAFETVEVESGGRYAADLAPALTLDLAVQKFLWDGRLRAQAVVRNLLGAELRYHPAGAAFAPTALVRLEARLP